MPYSTPNIPRFYIDIVSWTQAVGHINRGYPSGFQSHMINFLWDPYEGSAGSAYFGLRGNIYIPKYTPINYIAILGHNFGGVRTMPVFYGEYDDGSSYSRWSKHKEIINSTTETYLTPKYHGFTIAELTASEDGGFDPAGNDVFFDMLHLTFRNSYAAASDPPIIPPHNFNYQSLLVGSFYDIPHSSELNMTMSREMDGIKRSRTRGGSDLIHRRYIRPPKWGNHPVWELWDETANTYIGNEGELSRIGRRTWSLSFNSLHESDLFPDSLNIGWENNYNNEDDAYGKLLLNETTFYNQVIHMTNGGQLPFIFNPDGGGDNPNNNPDMFAICKFDMKSFQFRQVSNGIYNIKLKIKEIW